MNEEYSLRAQDMLGPERSEFLLTQRATRMHPAKTGDDIVITNAHSPEGCDGTHCIWTGKEDGFIHKWTGRKKLEIQSPQSQSTDIGKGIVRKLDEYVATEEWKDSNATESILGGAISMA